MTDIEKAICIAIDKANTQACDARTQRDRALASARAEGLVTALAIINAKVKDCPQNLFNTRDRVKAETLYIEYAGNSAPNYYVDTVLVGGKKVKFWCDHEPSDKTLLLEAVTKQVVKGLTSGQVAGELLWGSHERGCWKLEDA